MGLFGLGRPTESPVPLPIPRATRTWPKAQPKPALNYAPPAVERAIVLHQPVASPPPAPLEAKPAAVVEKAASWGGVAAKPVLTPAAIRAAVAPALAAAAPAPAARRPDPVFFVARAAAKQARGDHAGAIEDFSRAIEIDPQCVTAWAGRAVSLEEKGDVDAARRNYAKSIEIELKGEIARQQQSGPSLDVRA